MLHLANPAATFFWTRAKPKSGYTNANRYKIEVISESRPDRGGFVGVDIRYLRRDEDGSVFMNEIGCESKTCLHAIGNDGYRRGGRDLAFTHGFVDGGFDFANGTERLRKRVVVAMEGSGESRQEKTIYR